jgi:protocatechuate 3,4-dioxygenase beta subunit
MNRKNFITKAALAAFSLSATGFIKPTSTGFEGDCETTNDILGPFYRSNAPMRKNLMFEGIEGSAITIKGTVRDADCKPLANALVEIWHCDVHGSYDNKSSAFKHRASWKTNDKGLYAFKTIMPGKYLNGRLYRPAHIHFRITADGYSELISQLYFKGDPHISEDPWASQPKAIHRVLPVEPVGLHGELEVTFDIGLSPK